MECDAKQAGIVSRLSDNMPQSILSQSHYHLGFRDSSRPRGNKQKTCNFIEKIHMIMCRVDYGIDLLPIEPVAWQFEESALSSTSMEEK